MCKELSNTILTINSSETLLWWLCNLLSMITMLLRLIGPLLIQGSRIQLIIFVLTVFTAVSRSGAGQSCGGEWFIISSENQPRLPATNYVSDPVEAPTDGHCTAWLSPDLRAMFDDCRPQCANNVHSTVGTEVWEKFAHSVSECSQQWLYNTWNRHLLASSHNILCLSGVCTFAPTSACDWSTGTHVSQLSQSQAEVAAIVHTSLKQQMLWCDKLSVLAEVWKW